MAAIPDVHGHAKGEHKSFAEERPIAYSPRMLFLWFYHACRRGAPRFMMVADHINYLTFEDPGAVHTVRRALKLAEAGDLYGAAETAGVDVSHAAVVSQGLRRGMHFSIGAELDNDPRSRPDAQNIVDAMRPDGMIRSVHFLTIDHPEKGPDFQWPFDNAEFADLYEIVGVERTWELYISKLVDDIEKLPGNIVGHFYVPANFGHWPERSKLESYEDRMLDACAARGMAVEINTRLLYRDTPAELKAQYREALIRLMKKAKVKDVGIAIASDAHSPKDQGNAFDQVLGMLDEAGINEIVFPVGGRLARVALRATKEHLQKVKAQEPAPQPGSSISGFSRAELGLPEREEAEERAAAAASKTSHDEGPRKRASSPARGTKKAARSTTSAREARSREQEPSAPPAPLPQPKRKAEVKVAKPVAKPAGKPAAKPVAKPAAKTPAAKTPAAKTPAKAASKAAKAPAPQAKTKTVAKANAVSKTASSAKAKASAKKVAPVKKQTVKITAKKAAPAKKTAPAKKAAAKRTPAKKASARKPAAPKTKKTSVKSTKSKKATSKRR